MMKAFCLIRDRVQVISLFYRGERRKLLIYWKQEGLHITVTENNNTATRAVYLDVH
jgi:hypothetical protein